MNYDYPLYEHKQCCLFLSLSIIIDSRAYVDKSIVFSAGNYSALKFTFKLGREVGYYLMDYFIPSMMIVAMSWVTFWLQADAAAPRITLGKIYLLELLII